MNNKIYNVILLRVIIYFLRITKAMLHSIIFMSYSESLHIIYLKNANLKGYHDFILSPFSAILQIETPLRFQKRGNPPFKKKNYLLKEIKLVAI